MGGGPELDLGGLPALVVLDSHLALVDLVEGHIHPCTHAGAQQRDDPVAVVEDGAAGQRRAGGVARHEEGDPVNDRFPDCKNRTGEGPRML